MHKVDGGASGSQFSSDGTQDFERRLMEWEEMPKLFLSDSSGPGKTALIVEIIAIDSVRIDDLAHTGEYNVIIPVIIFTQQRHKLQAIIGNNIFHAHLALDRLLRSTHRPDSQIVYFSKPVGKHHQRLLIVHPLFLVAIFHKKRDLDHMFEHVLGLCL